MIKIREIKILGIIFGILFFWNKAKKSGENKIINKQNKRKIQNARKIKRAIDNLNARKHNELREEFNRK